MSKSIDVRRREETKQINLCFLHMVVAVPTIFAEPLVWVERWSSGGKICFMTKGRFTSMAWFLGCIVLRPLSAGGGRNARDYFRKASIRSCEIWWRISYLSKPPRYGWDQICKDHCL